MGFPGTGKIWMNGSLVDWNDAKIHIGSHIVHYGSGVFEGARCYDTAGGSACFRLDAHIRRLFDSARIYRMESRAPTSPRKPSKKGWTSRSQPGRATRRIRHQPWRRASPITPTRS
jgi:branched-subunit amino acid aminotransferase/4-amino-4-deoxychorismate lyase